MYGKPRLENLSVIVIELSKHHADCIWNNLQCKDKKKEQNPYNVDNTKLVEYLCQSWEKFSSKDISRDEIENKITNLFEDKNTIWNSIEDVLFINYESRCIPNIYDLLETIFQNTNLQKRQKYYHKLIWIYYENLKLELQIKNVCIASILSSIKFQELLKQFLPIVKLDLGNSCLEDPECIDSDKTKLFKELVECLTFPSLLREDCYKILENLDDGDYDYFEFMFNPNMRVSGNLAEYYRLHLSVSKGDHVVCYQFFAKRPSNINEDVKKFALHSFKKEEFFYNIFMGKFQEENLDDISDFAPKCYFVRNNDLLVLEDLAVQGFTLADARQPENFQFFSQSIQALAKLHAGSLILEEKISKSTGKIYRCNDIYEEYLNESFFHKDNTILLQSSNYIVDYFLEKFPEVLRGMDMDEFKIKAREQLDLMFENVNKSFKYRNVICHGDVWANNIFYKQESDLNIKSYLIDFRFIRYCPPFIDLLNFIYLNTDKEFRNLYKEEFIKIYKDNLADNLQRFEIDIDEIYEGDSFEQSCEDNVVTAICTGLLFNQVFLIPKDISPIYTNDDESTMDFYNSDRREVYEEALKDEIYRSRIKELIEELYEICIKTYN